MYKHKKLGGFILLMCFTMLMLGACVGKAEHGLSAKSPTVVTIWHYYNGAQKEQFDRLVNEFNETEGMKKGVVIDAFSKGTISELTQSVTDAINKKVGAEKLPDVVAAYSDTAYLVDQVGLSADLSLYFTKQELDEYIDAYIEEGKIDGTDSIKLFPIAKSTELFAINYTDWEPFAAATGATEESFQTWEGIAKVAKEYYEWTGGKAFFGRDAFANYMIIGSQQLGHEIFQVKDGIVTLDFDERVMKRLWDNYYVPYISGHFASFGKFRSDDVKTGDLIALVGSTSGMAYFPNEVTKEDGSTYPIETKIYPLPNFEGTSPYAVQQGAGMLVLKSNETKEYAVSLFLKWFTKEENNIVFSIDSGYLPVKKEANNLAKVEKVLSEQGIQTTDALQKSLYAGLKIASEYSLYATKPFKSSTNTRNIVNATLPQKAKEDRESVVKLIEEGMKEEEAIASFVTDANFKQWYEDTKAQLTAIGE